MSTTLTVFVAVAVGYFAVQLHRLIRAVNACANAQIDVHNAQMARMDWEEQVDALEDQSNPFRPSGY